MKRALARTAVVLGALLALATLAATVLAWPALGHRPDGARRARMERSPEWKDGKFHDPQPLVNDAWGSVVAMFHADPHASPDGPLPFVAVDPRRPAPESGLRVTWFGHSSTLVEVDGHRVLTDPIWSERSSPLPFVGPRRWSKPIVPLEQLRPIDAVVISHDHYDHLDMETIVAMKDWDTVFVVPLGVGAHLAAWGVPEAKIVELDWWERTRRGDLQIASVPARHASGRSLLDFDTKLWTGYALLGARHRVYYSGDTGLFPAMKDIGDRLGPFDLAMIEAGQYHQAWPDWHIGPEQALLAYRLVRGRVLLPVHWGLFTLALHGWTEPIERVLAAARPGEVVIAPRPGQAVEPSAPPPLERWWPALPWRSGQQDPIVSTQLR